MFNGRYKKHSYRLPTSISTSPPLSHFARHSNRGLVPNLVARKCHQYCFVSLIEQTGLSRYLPQPFSASHIIPIPFNSTYVVGATKTARTISRYSSIHAKADEYVPLRKNMAIISSMRLEIAQ
eukprot:gb/GEZJ01004287.1/.p1 GENE.gb/GEZJ01004287.1/~~gb/GEZJ01004287.1/.p1  ORF type:complete len:123 (+),score=4.43 gb/GEZJ01004287.1/:289-657(+)